MADLVNYFIWGSFNSSPPESRPLNTGWNLLGVVSGSLLILDKAVFKKAQETMFCRAFPGCAIIASGFTLTGGFGALLIARDLFLPFISSAFVPTESMPSVVRAFAENQPVTSIVESIRALLSGQPMGNELWAALAWCVGIMLLAYIFAMRVYKQRI